MANNTPTSNQLNINLGKLLNDSPTVGGDDGVTASTDGSIVTASQRNSKLIEGFTWVINQIVQLIGMDKARLLLGNSVTTQSITFAVSVVASNKDYLYPVALLDSNNNEFNLHPLKNLKQDLDPFLDAGYAIEGGFIYPYKRTSGTLALVTTGTGLLYYLKADRKVVSTGADVAVNTAPDTTMDYKFLNAAMYYAASRLASEKGSAEWEIKASKALAEALGLVGKNA